jgi:hypothetical protein
MGFVVVAGLVGMTSALLAAQGIVPIQGPGQAATSVSSTAAEQVIPLRVDVVFTRSLAAKKISSIPYTLVVSALPMAPELLNRPQVWPQGQNTSLRLGADVYTGRSVSNTNDGKTSSTPEYRYIGTDIDCRADHRGAGVYRLYLNLSDNTLATSAAGPGELGNSVGAAVRRFVASNVITVRDGQSSQFAVGTDPLSGETVRVDVTATAIK